MTAEPLREVLRSGEPRVLSEITDDVLDQVIRDPAHREIIRKVAPKSSIAVPLAVRGQMIGVLQVGVGESRPRLGNDDVPLVLEIAHVATLAIENARLYEATKQHGEEQRFLSEVGATLAATLDYSETLQTVARLAVRELADWCVVDLVDNSVNLRRLKVVHSNPEKARLCEALERMPVDRRRPNLTSSVLETREPSVVSEVNAGYLESISQSDEHLRVLRELEPKSIMGLPLLARDRLIGVITLVSSHPSRRYGAEDLSLAQELANRAALAVENAQLYQIARRAIQARDDVMAIVSHDLKNPLNTIRLSLAFLSRGAGPAGERRKGRKQLDVIDRSALRLEQIIEGLRDAAMIETGQFTVEPKAEDVPALLSEAASLLEPQAAARGLQLKVDVSDDIPTIQCDRGRVLQVIGNLVGNAIKFTQSGGEIRIAVRPVDDAIQVSVSDTGAGIPENQIPHIFERYWKGKTKGIQGTGLGLYIVKAIVKAHGGRIWVESAVAEGTTFFFTLPVVPSAVAEPRPSERGAEYPPPFDLPV